MKKTIGIILLILIIILILLPFLKSYFKPDYHYVQFKDVFELQDYLKYLPSREPLIGAHRGGPMPGYPENCLAAFQNSLKYAPCLIECDVRISGDDQLIMLHDDTLGRTTTGSGAVSNFTLKELEQLSLKDIRGEVTDYKIPTLSNVLDWAVGKAIVELDIKQGIEPQVILSKILEHNALPYSVVITYNLEQLNTYANIHPELMISASAHTVEGVNRILDTGIDPARLLVFVGVTEPDIAVYELLHDNGIRAILGTMHNIDNAAKKRGTKVYRDVLSHGADILATDNVPLAAKAITEFFREAETFPVN